MPDLYEFTHELSKAQPSYNDSITQLCTLASTSLPPFIYVMDPNYMRFTASVVDAIFRQGSSNPDFPPTLYARVNAVATFSAHVFYDTVLNSLAGWVPTWDNGCQVWPGEDGVRYNDSIDSFLRGIRRLFVDASSGAGDKGKGKATETRAPSLVLLVERAERLCDNLPELVVPLTRLSELARARISVIFLSSSRWEDIRPPLGASPDPYFLNVESLAKADLIQHLISAFRNTSRALASSDVSDITYHPSLLPLYEQYAEVLCSTISLYVNDPVELQYIAAARWPGFVRPVVSQQDDSEDHSTEVQLPGVDGRMRLFGHFSGTFTRALEVLYPRLTNATDWARENCNHRLKNPTEMGDDTAKERALIAIRMDYLPRLSKFILIAAFVASTNPAKSDLRMFGRGTVERKTRRRKAGSPTKGGAVKATAISQRLLGPATFPLDRLLAILGALLEEHDFESRPYDPRFELPGEYTEMEIGRIHVYAAIAELSFMRALHRMSALDKLDGPPTFKCGISYEVALTLARDVGITSLGDLLWDTA